MRNRQGEPRTPNFGRMGATLSGTRDSVTTQWIQGFREIALVTLSVTARDKLVEGGAEQKIAKKTKKRDWNHEILESHETREATRAGAATKLREPTKSILLRGDRYGGQVVPEP